jgi:hypothetical protein
MLNQSMELKSAVINLKRENDELRDEFSSKLKEQSDLIQELIEETLRLTRKQLLSPPVETVSEAPIPSSSKQISSPIQKMLNNYENLDDDTKKHLFQNALLTNNDALQRELMNLQQNKISSSVSLQAKLAKELMKISETYKIPELTFDTKAKTRRSNYFTWCSKLHPILAMFPQTSKLFQDNEIISYENPEDIGNKALYILISSKVDEYFQRAIKQFEGYGDKALSFIKIQCANINSEDTHHFHHLFTTLRIKDNESATNFFQRFTFAKTEAEAAGNSYTEQQLVSFALAGMNNTSDSKYDIALQLYHLEREQVPTKFSLEHLEKKFFTMDEQTAQDNALTRIALGQAANSKRLQHDKSKGRNSNNKRRLNKQINKNSRTYDESANAANQRKIFC